MYGYFMITFTEVLMLLPTTYLSEKFPKTSYIIFIAIFIIFDMFPDIYFFFDLDLKYELPLERRTRGLLFYLYLFLQVPS